MSIKIVHVFIAMVAVVAASNYLVLFSINDWLTFGAFSYPVSFLITEVTNRLFGAQKARHVVYVGFVVGVILSIKLAGPKIALASGTAFFVSQLLDISIFNKLRTMTWWYAPLVSSAIASIIDTAIFWSIAFWGEPLPVVTWALGDLCVKFGMDLAMLAPFRMMLYSYRTQVRN